MDTGEFMGVDCFLQTRTTTMCECGWCEGHTCDLSAEDYFWQPNRIVVDMSDVYVMGDV